MKQVRVSRDRGGLFVVQDRRPGLLGLMSGEFWWSRLGILGWDNYEDARQARDEYARWYGWQVAADDGAKL